MQYVLALTAAMLLNAAANLLMKIGMKSVAQAGGVLRDGLWAAIREVLTHVPLVIGLICFGLNAALYMYALQSKALKISVAYPIMVGGGYVVITLVARFHPALRERLSSAQMFGAGLVMVGIVIIATQSSGSSSVG